jgi:hypothetical protein
MVFPIHTSKNKSEESGHSGYFEYYGVQEWVENRGRSRNQQGDQAQALV